VTSTIETHILRMTVDALLTITGKVGLCYEDDWDGDLTITAETSWETIQAEAYACDSCTLRVGSKWVWFIWDNGEDGLTCIADYTVSLEDVMMPVFDWIEVEESEQ